EQAQSNAKSGINLVQTAEGALTEVHSMLNRMVTLADQSANGTYDNETDRANLQKEVSQLKSEINRIADSSNFNGINLLDGSLSANGASASVPEITGLDTSTTAATKAAPTAAFTAITGSLTNGTKLTATFNYTDADGSAKSSTLELTADSTGKKLVTAGGKEIAIADGTKATANELASAFAAAAAEDAGLSSTFKISSGATLNLTAKTAGANTKLNSVTQDWTATTFATATKTLATLAGTAGADAFDSINFADATAYTVGDSFTIGGQKFAFVETQADAVAKGEDGVNAIVIAAGAGGTVATADVAGMKNLIEQKTGYAPTINATATQLDFKAPAGSTGKGGLTLQIGDTAEKFNQLTVSVGDMHAKALGIGDIDISTQAGASSAIEKIKSAINSVSSTRGDLGATQNRLDHTINNLSVMTENIQDAESTVRDTDVAKEMMSYTKNNILVQSAQAMLAQANQVPQGVLQLLQ
ncbi:flagellin, partial [Oscillibacter ruminantium]|uniref:flagellin n=1 Tax=Oscillibacter ruminantium TaxID=1263547 RepID=UPI003320CEBD